MPDWDVRKMEAQGDVDGLARALVYAADWQTRLSAAEALDRLGWKPEKDEAGAAYWFTKGEWARCAGIGRPAVRMLLELLDAVREREPRLAAVRMLAEMYNEGALSDDESELLRTESASLGLEHDDGKSHDDWICREDETHADQTCHDDTMSGSSVCL